MKTFKKVALSIIVIFALTIGSAYFYFNQKFAPVDNYLSVTGQAENVKISWIASDGNPHSALLLPIKIKGSEKTFYMQFDTGSPVTIFYRTAVESIPDFDKIPLKTNSEKNEISTSFSIGKMTINSTHFQLLDYGQKVDFAHSENVNILGTIGTDLLEKRVVSIDFKTGQCAFANEPKTSGFHDFEFRKRKILFPANVAGENLKLLYDSGTSGFELILNKEKFDQFKLQNSKLKIEKGNSWGKTLKVISAQADQKIAFGHVALQLSEVTNIEGTSALQNFLMKSSGMQGMIGNKLFLQHKLTLDCKRQKFNLE